MIGVASGLVISAVQTMASLFSHDDKALIFASYGGADVTNVVRGRLQQQGTLNFGPKEYTWMGNPAPGEHKDFVVVSLDNSVHPNRFRVNLFEDHEPC